MAKIRVRPRAVLEAIRFTAETLDEAVEFCGGRYEYEREHGEVIYIDHPQGWPTRVHRGEYIIKGVTGHFFVCRPDVFERVYELAGG